MKTVDAVVIGRNEGARLLACLASLKDQIRHVVYVDSGSSDGSMAQAQAMGAEVVALDMSAPFTAARARNAGLARLQGAEFVQFIDGDCTLAPDWIAKGLGAFEAHPQAVAICGRRRERHPEASVYNRLADREWDTPIGEAKACGGDVLMAVAPLRAVGGYREDLIAGEEPELCQRLRRAGGQIWRIDAEMTGHDAAIFRFSQWFNRTRRAGYAFAEGAALHGQGPDRHWVKESRRALFWGLGLPLVLLLAGLIHPALWLGLLLYPLQMLRLWRAWGDGEVAFFNVLGKFPEALGALTYWADRLRGRKRGLIEYK